MGVVHGRLVLQKTEVMNCGHAKRMSYQPHMQTQQTKHILVTSIGRTQRLINHESMGKTDNILLTSL